MSKGLNMAKTAIAEAFERAGFSRAEMEFYGAVMRYLKTDGSTKERAIELVEGAVEKLLGGAAQTLPQGQEDFASAQQSESDDAGQRIAADGQRGTAPSSPLKRITLIQQGYRTGEGRFTQRPPTPGARAAATVAARHAAMTIFDSFKVRDGRAIGDVYMSELSELRAASIMEAAVLTQIRNHAAFDPTKNQKVREVIKMSELELFVQRGAGIVDAS